eukprot:scaffold9199_cov178-Skeletonema_dohrnii-CCMP3373.AAC.3
MLGDLAGSSFEGGEGEGGRSAHQMYYDIKPLNWVTANEAVIGGQSAFAVPITVPSALQL